MGLFLQLFLEKQFGFSIVCLFLYLVELRQLSAVANPYSTLLFRVADFVVTIVVAILFCLLTGFVGPGLHCQQLS